MSDVSGTPAPTSMIETVDILSRPEDVTALSAALAELEKGDVSSVDEVREAMVGRSRLPR